MLQFIKIIILSLTLATIFLGSAYAKKASLVLFPTILELTGKDRRATIDVINKGDARGLYRLSFVDTEMSKAGALLHLDEDEKRDYSLKPVVRISPRRMLLEPGQSQKVRIIIRKPDGLGDGEYRAHLKVKLLEDNVDKKGRPIVIERKAVGLELLPKARHVSAIPIFISFGDLPKPYVTLSDARFLNEEGKPTVKFSINREGVATVRGELKVFYIDGNGKSTLVKYVGGIPVYNPTPTRDITLSLDVPDGLEISGGNFKIIYSEAENKGGNIIADLVF